MKRRKRIYYTDTQKTLMWDRWQQGESLHQIAALFDRHHSSVRSILAEHGYDAKPLAGGQSLIPTMNFRLAQPGLLVDLNNIPDLSYVRLGSDGSLHIGAMTRHSTVSHEAPSVRAASDSVTAFMPCSSETMAR